MFQNGFLPGAAVDVGVEFGGEDAFVPEHFLHDAQVCAVFDEVRRKGMPEGMRRYLLAHPGGERLSPHHFEDRNAAERLSEAVQEEPAVIGAGRNGTLRKVIGDGVCGTFSHRHQTLLVPLARHAHEALALENVRQEQGAGLGNAQAAAVKQFENGAVALPLPGTRVDAFDNRGDFLFGQDVGQVAPQLRRIDRIAGIVRTFAFEDEVVEKGLDGAQFPRLRTAGNAFGTRCEP